jgi:8-oxo-dGTP pyrophosphatase MutT (NUDIX family)
MKRPKILGKITYVVNYPLIYGHLLGSRRAYALIKVDNKILLTKNWLGLHHHWRLPGGGVKAGEDSLKALIREVYEEVGIKLKASQAQLLTPKDRWSKHNFCYQIYEVRLKTKPQLCLANGELVYAQFFSQKQAKKMPLSEVTAAAVALGDQT